MRRLILSIALLLPAPCLGQAGADSRIRAIDYVNGGLYHVQTSPETIQTVLLAPGDPIRSVIVSDPNAYVLSVAGSGDSLSVKATGPRSLAVVSVRTEQRSYELELAAGGSEPAPAVVRFSYDGGRQASASSPAASIQKVAGIAWRLSGSKALRPSDIGDDGSRTYIAWRGDQAMPAVFALGPGRAEQMVDGYMRSGLFTIDRVHEHLVFRIDKEVATARRIKKKERER